MSSKSIAWTIPIHRQSPKTILSGQFQLLGNRRNHLYGQFEVLLVDSRQNEVSRQIESNQINTQPPESIADTIKSRSTIEVLLVAHFRCFVSERWGSLSPIVGMPILISEKKKSFPDSGHGIIRRDAI